MIWNDKKILQRITNRDKEVEELKVKVRELKESNLEHDEIYKYFDDKNHIVLEKIDNATGQTLVLEKRINDLCDTTHVLNRTLNSKINDVESRLRDELEFSLRGVVNVLDKRLEDLGEKKGIVTDLLKRIAKLEGPNE